MRKLLCVVLAGLWIAMSCSLAGAEDKKDNMMGQGMMQGGMKSEEGMTMDKDKMMGKGNMCGAMMNSMMMGKSLVVTSDGGVILLIGNKLQKYDKDLVLQKEVEIKVDMESMQKMMKQMMEKCPMHEQMMKGKAMGEAKEESKVQ